MNREKRIETINNLKKMKSEELIQLGLHVKFEELHGKISKIEMQEHVDMIEKVLKERGRTLDITNI